MKIVTTFDIFICKQCFRVFSSRWSEQGAEIRFVCWYQCLAAGSGRSIRFNTSINLSERVLCKMYVSHVKTRVMIIDDISLILGRDKNISAALFQIEGDCRQFSRWLWRGIGFQFSIWLSGAGPLVRKMIWDILEMFYCVWTSSEPSVLHRSSSADCGIVCGFTLNPLIHTRSSQLERNVIVMTLIQVVPTGDILLLVIFISFVTSRDQSE